MRALKWRLHLAVGAWARAREEIDRLKGRVNSTEKLSLALMSSQKELEDVGRRFVAASERASRLAEQVKELEGFREQLNKAQLELSQIKAANDENIRAMQLFHEKRWDQLRASHATEKDAWNKKLGEVEHERRRQRDQLDILNKELAEVEKRLEKSNEVTAGLSNELDLAHEEIGNNRSRIGELKEDLRRAQSDKSKALNRVHELGNALARREGEIRKRETEFQQRLRAFGEEMASTHRKCSELEKRLAEADARASSAVEEYKSSARFMEERREACADAFRLCEEDIRARISRAHPEWDLSFLDAELMGACTPGTDEAEYGDASDVDLEAVLGPDNTAASGGNFQRVAGEESTFEVGGTSRASPSATEEAAGTTSVPNP